MSFLQRKGTHHGYHDYFRPDQFTAPADAAGYEASGSWGAYAIGLHSARPTFAAFLGRPPDTENAEDLRRFQLDQHRSAVGPATINAVVSALRFLFTMTLKRLEIALGLSVIRCEPKLRDVLSVEEAARLIEAAPGIKYNAAFSVAYGAGLRVSEVTHLKVGDIDSERMIIRVEQGKGRKDRNAMLSPHLLGLLRQLWREGKRRGVMLPHGWLFPGRNCTDPISVCQLNHVVHKAAEFAGIHKLVSPHTLPIRLPLTCLSRVSTSASSWCCWGHTNIDTTAIYTKVPSKTMRAVASPLDQIVALMEGRAPPG